MRVWLEKELKDRGWSHRELARRSGLSQTSISSVLSEADKQKPGLDFCVAVSGPLGEKPETIMRLAGLLPPLPETVQEEDEIIDIIRRLPKMYRLFVLQMLRGVNNQPRPQAEQSESGGDFRAIDLVDLMLKVYETPPETIRQATLYLEHKRDALD